MLLAAGLVLTGALSTVSSAATKRPTKATVKRTTKPKAKPMAATSTSTIVVKVSTPTTTSVAPTATALTTGPTTTQAQASATTQAAALATIQVTATAKDNDATAGVKAAKWSNNVKITYAESTFTFTSSGLPSHELPDQFLVPSGQPTDPNVKWVAKDTKTFIKGSTLTVQLPLRPTYSTAVTKTSLGQIGVMISGAQLFNDYEDPQLSVVAIDDNKRVTPVGAYFLDACSGHPLQSGADYHYHGVPYCITDTVDVANEHFRIIGFVRDGFPVYGPRNASGKKLTNADLDECSGHVGVTPEFPNGIYHYHLTDDAAPYSLNCYHGVVATRATGAAAGAATNAPANVPTANAPTAGGPPAAMTNANTPAAGNATATPTGMTATTPAATNANGAPAGGGPANARPDFTVAAATLGITTAKLEAALGQPPFNLDIAATKLGVTKAALQAALPAPPQGNGG
jgi:hypothetical protein